MHRLFRLSAVVALLALVVASAAVATAQDATPMASPAASPAASPTSTCGAPLLPPGTPTPHEGASPVASPAAMIAASPAAMASPGPMASPAMVATPVGTPTSDADTSRVSDAVNLVMSCLSGGDYAGAVALFTPNMVRELAGTDNPYDAVAALQGINFNLQDVTNIQLLPDGRYGAEVTYILLPLQIVREQWYLVDQGGTLMVDGFALLQPQAPAGVQQITVTMTDFAFQFSQRTASVGNLLLRPVNAGQYPHEIVMLQLPEGATMAQVISGAVPQDQVTVIATTGQPVAPGETAPDIYIVGLKPGTYTLACYLTAPDGTPHVLKGMTATLTVQ